MRNMIIGLTIFILPFITYATASAETVIGRWCDRMIPTMPKHNGVITILVTDQGGVEARIKYNDGSNLKNKLKEMSGNIFATIGSSSGDKYRVSSSTGDLQLLDNDGLIRVAKRLENKPSGRECK